VLKKLKIQYRLICEFIKYMLYYSLAQWIINVKAFIHNMSFLLIVPAPNRWWGSSIWFGKWICPCNGCPFTSLVIPTKCIILYFIRSIQLSIVYAFFTNYLFTKTCGVGAISWCTTFYNLFRLSNYHLRIVPTKYVLVIPLLD
jgi:hypothetical protein